MALIDSWQEESKKSKKGENKEDFSLENAVESVIIKLSLKDKYYCKLMSKKLHKDDKIESATFTDFFQYLLHSFQKDN